ncbi:ATP-binding protein [Maribius pontilimi]|uniref:ATP-binding protein n=1 Tax=Palleronia pontilimi TaxID=1964209 RepID=A0A934MHA0_9RHOB|nr:ATP-binding protein [Palleronia pontilimi]MBJ3763129.1 ATP-binding protein [Palleronia pontilimi]
MRSDPDADPRGEPSHVIRESWRNELRILFPSGALAVRDALASTMDGLRHLRLDPEDRSTIELVLAEVLNNIVEHGYPDNAPGMIELYITHDPGGLSCVALDSGRAMPGKRLPIPHPPDPDQPPPSLSEGGFGWFLIRELSSDLSYQRVGNRNRLSFRLDLTHRIQSC